MSCQLHFLAVFCSSLVKANKVVEIIKWVSQSISAAIQSETLLGAENIYLPTILEKGFDLESLNSNYRRKDHSFTNMDLDIVAGLLSCTDEQAAMHSLVTLCEMGEHLGEYRLFCNQHAESLV